MEPTDEEIARAVQQGDREAFGVLVLRYQPKMARYARKFLFRADDAADLVQDVFIKAYTNIQGFDASRRFSPWIYRVAHNIFVNALRDNEKYRRDFSLFDADVLFPHPVAAEKTDDHAKREEAKRMLDASLAPLDPKLREPLVLYYIEDLDYKTISQVLHVPISTVAARVKRGMSIIGKTMRR